jgi:3-oxoacyl-[acyl-carrier protein] reductase
MLRINFNAPFFITQQALPRIRDGGRIINVSSTATRLAWAHYIVYGPSKGALE